MSKPQLTLACGPYDRTQALRDRSVEPEGIELNYVTLPPPETFRRMFKYEEFDIAEVSLASYLLERSCGITRFIAIPVFPSRMFRHGHVFVNNDSGIERPEDLAGKRIGSPEYQLTAAVWIRGFLQHDYGVKPDSVHWVAAGLEPPERKEIVEIPLPPSIRVEPIPRGKTLSGMLESGELDAYAGANAPSCFVNKSPKVRRLFPDYQALEMEYFKRTKLFPIMHVIAIREELYRKHRWVAQSLYKAFCRAKDECYRTMTDVGPLRYTLPWFQAELERERRVLGHDLWPYGLEPNRVALEALIQYCLEQGLAKNRLEIESLFTETTLEGTTVYGERRAINP